MSAICSASDADKSDSKPQIRNFVQFSSFGSNYNLHGSLRILQFNVLADGLSALRSDHGNFSRTKYEDLVWETRSQYLLFEILQYKPDVVTLQECDHFDDFFEPELKRHGYKGYFAPKSDSTCLEVSDRCDGCAIFVKSDKLKVTSNKVLTYEVSKAQVRLQPGDDYKTAAIATAVDETPLAAEDHLPKPQNQLALILTCELRNHSDSESGVRSLPVPVFIATTHLKAMKSAVGERYRAVEMQQLIRKVHETRINLTRLYNVKPAVIITGDLNACPPSQSQGSGYKSLTFETIKSEENQSLLRLNSVYNDDYVHLLSSDGSYVGANKTGSSLWTTWKSRVKNGSESVVKQCIDYILYNTNNTDTETTAKNNNSVLANTATSADYADDYDRTVAANTTSTSGIGMSDCVAELYVVPSAVLEIYADAYVSEHFMPSAIYPSDHLAICADLKVVE